MGQACIFTAERHNKNMGVGMDLSEFDEQEVPVEGDELAKLLFEIFPEARY